MIPTGVATVVAFFFFVIPGLVWQFWFERRRPAKVESAFREASRVALVSTPFSAAAVAIVLFATWRLDQHWLSLLSTWFTTGKAQSAEALVVAAVVALLELGVALGLAAIVWWRLADRLYGNAKVLQVSAWSRTLARPPDGTVMMATVQLSDGTSYRGQVGAFSPDLAWGDREILLIQPLSFFRPGSGLVRMPEQFLTIPSSSIIAVASMTVNATAIAGVGGGGVVAPAAASNP